MLDKTTDRVEDVIAEIEDGASIMVSGFGTSGQASMLLGMLLDHSARDLTLISNNAGDGPYGFGALILEKRCAKLMCSFPRGALGTEVEKQVHAGTLELEVMPQGTLAERIRAAGAGVSAFFTPTAYGTKIAEGKESRIIDGRGHVLEYALPADYAFVKADRADRWGNLTYNKLARNFAPIMATAGRKTIVQAMHVVELGAINPEHVVTPGIFVDVVAPYRATEAETREYSAA